MRSAPETPFGPVRLIAFASVFASLLFAQGSAEVGGTVTDATQKATISGASVTITRTETGAEKKTVTDDQGIYIISGLTPGTYELQLRKDGFQTLVRSDIKLQAGDKMQLDFEMSLGATAQAVTVTAEKRSELILDVPVPVSVVNTNSLTENNQVLLRDYYAQVPGVTLLPSFEDSQFIAIRGITTGGFTNPTVGITVDDVPFGGSTQSLSASNVPDLDPSDLDRVEVLRGPQGTLYGDNSMGGQLKYVTKDPVTDGYSFNLQAGTGGVYNAAKPGFNLRGSANVPLSDTLAFRVSAFKRQDPGYIDNPSLHLKGVNDALSWGIRLSVMWRPTKAFYWKLGALYQNTRGNGTSEVYLLPGLGDLQQTALRGTGNYHNTYQAYSSSLTYKLGRIDLTSVTGYNVDRHRDFLDYTATFGAAVQAAFGPNITGASLYSFGDTQKFTQEVRASVPLGQHFNWLIGAFYDHDEAPDQHQVTSGVDPSTGIAAAPYYISDFPRKFQEYALFTDLTWRLNDRFDVQIGARESHTVEDDAPNVKTGPYTLVYLHEPSPVVVPAIEAKGDAFTYLFTPRFKVSSGFMLYTRLASGYRPGGANPNALAAASLPKTYSPDKTNNYEIGAKADFAEGRLSVDTSLYYIDWSKIQIFVLDPTTHLAYTANGGQAKSEGVEFALTARPWKGMAASGWVSYDDAVLTEKFPATATVYGHAGDRLPNSTRLSGHISWDQRFPIKGHITGFVGGEADFVGDRLSVFQATALRQVFPAYTQTNVRAGVEYDSWKVNIFANNVGDVRGVLNGGIGYLIPYAFYYINPRSVGVNVTKSFACLRKGCGDAAHQSR